MNLLSLKDISLSLKSGPLFESVTIDIDEADKIGLIGLNGSGKSSFLKLITGAAAPDHGEIALAKRFSYSFLPQKSEFSENTTLGDFLYLGDATEILHPAEEEPRVSLENRYSALCKELNLPALDTPMKFFSGGELKKAELARALAPSARLLILDEPTNHLDVDTIEWLEKKLQTSRQAIILVTHDRWFLDAVVTRIAEIDRHTITMYPGSYSRHLERKAVILAGLERAENKRLANLKIELAWLNRGARARATKSERRKQEIRAMSESLLEKPPSAYSFSSSETRLGKKVCVMTDVSFSYGTKQILKDFSFEFQPGEKLAIVGPNGSGKTSLLKLISGMLTPDSGTIELGSTVRLSYFRQTNESLDGEKSILAFIQEHADHFKLADGSVLDAELLLERFGYDRDFRNQKIKTLSGGEVRRLMLVRILAESPNMLLLDEPTNDLDIETIERLEEYLEDFGGTVILVSHDRLLVDKLAQNLLIFKGNGVIERYSGSYLEWSERKEQEISALPSVEKSKSKKPAAAENRRDNPQKASAGREKLSFKEKREFENLLNEIDALENEKRTLEESFANPKAFGSDIQSAHVRYGEIERLLEQKMARWEYLAEREG